MNTIKQILRLMTPVLIAVILLGLQSAHAVTITSAFTGSWYNPETPGQGFNLEIIEGHEDGNSVLAYSERLAPGRYFNTLFLDREGAVAETLGDLRDDPPAFILMQGGGRLPSELRRHVRRQYRVGFVRSGYTVLVPRRR